MSGKQIYAESPGNTFDTFVAFFLGRVSNFQIRGGDAGRKIVMPRYSNDGIF